MTSRRSDSQRAPSQPRAAPGLASTGNRRVSAISRLERIAGVGVRRGGIGSSPSTPINRRQSSLSPRRHDLAHQVQTDRGPPQARPAPIHGRTLNDGAGPVRRYRDLGCIAWVAGEPGTPAKGAGGHTNTFTNRPSGPLTRRNFARSRACFSTVARRSAIVSASETDAAATLEYSAQ